MKNKKTIILCEGSTDSIFVCKLLEDWLHLEKKRIRNGDYPFTNLGRLSADEHVEEYVDKSNKFLVDVISVGSCSKFKSFYSTYLEIPTGINDLRENYSFIVLTDSDYETSESILSRVGISFITKINTWETSSFIDSYSIKRERLSYLAVIPTCSPGALEKVLLNAFSSTNYEIFHAADTFVDNLPSHISSPFCSNVNKVNKAKLGICFLLKNPSLSKMDFLHKIALIDTSLSEIHNNFDFIMEM